MIELHDFCHKLRDKVREFERYAREANRDDPESSPIEGSWEDWIEYFQNYMEA